MSRRYPSNLADPIQVLSQGGDLTDRGSQRGEASGAISDDSVIADLRVRNIAEAVVQGRPGARRELGVLVYELLVCGGKGK